MIGYNQMNRWINEAGEIFSNNEISSQFIFNMDETWVATLRCQEKVIIDRSAMRENLQVNVKNDINEHFTLVLCQSASGRIIRPLLIVPRKKVPKELVPFSDTIHFAANPTGWMTSEIFEKWVSDVFLREIENFRRNMNAPDAKVILVVDNHTSRGNPVALRKLQNENIEVIGLVPHSSYFTQPLDLFANNAIKSEFTKLYNDKITDSAKERRLAIVECLLEAIPKISSDVKSLQDAFRRANLRPWNPSGLLEHPGVSKDIHEKERKKRSVVGDVGGILTKNDHIEKIEKNIEKKNLKEVNNAPQE